VRADVFTEAFFDFDVEAGLGRHLKNTIRIVALPSGLAIQLYPARVGDNLHSFGEIGAGVERAWINQAESFFAAVCKLKTVVGNLAVEIDVGSCDSVHAPRIVAE
jgi:hypothetical protein